MLALYTRDILLEFVCEGVCVCVDSNQAYTYITAGTVGSTLVPIIDSKQWFPPQVKVVWSAVNQPKEHCCAQYECVGGDNHKPQFSKCFTKVKTKRWADIFNHF